MRMLIVTPEFPYPLDQGGRIRMFNILKHLAKSHEIHLISVTLAPLAPSHLKELRSYCYSIHLISQADSHWHKVIRVVKSIVLRKPFVVFKHMSSALKRTLKTVTDQVHPDVILVEYHYTSDCVDGVNTRRVVDMPDIDYVLYDRFAKSPRWGVRKVHGLIQRYLMYEFERQIPRRFDACITVSERDSDLLREISGATNVTVVPNGVDIEYFKPYPASTQNYDLVYVGSMDYYPNIDAALFLCQEIMPRVWERRPHTTLAIVGRDPTAAVRALETDSRIRVTGTVDDVRPYLGGASVVMVPLRIGSGTRLKVLEAAAMGKAIVGTPVGLEGIDFEDGRHTMKAEGVDELASVTLDLLEHADKRARMGLAARLLVSERYSWSTCARQLEQVLDQVYRNRKVERCASA